MAARATTDNTQSGQVRSQPADITYQELLKAHLRLRKRRLRQTEPGRASVTSTSDSFPLHRQVQNNHSKLHQPSNVPRWSGDRLKAEYLQPNREASVNQQILQPVVNNHDEHSAIALHDDANVLATEVSVVDATNIATHAADANVVATIDEIVTPTRENSSALLVEDLLNLAGDQFVKPPFDDRSSPIPDLQHEEVAGDVLSSDHETCSDRTSHGSKINNHARISTGRKSPAMEGRRTKRRQPRDGAGNIAHINELHFQLLEDSPALCNSQEADEQSPVSSSDEDPIDVSQIEAHLSPRASMKKSCKGEVAVRTVTEIHTALRSINGNRKLPLPSTLKAGFCSRYTPGDGFTPEERKIPFWTPNTHSAQTSRKRRIPGLAPERRSFAPLALERLNIVLEAPASSPSSRCGLSLKDRCDVREEMASTQAATQHESYVSNDSQSEFFPLYTFNKEGEREGKEEEEHENGDTCHTQSEDVKEEMYANDYDDELEDANESNYGRSTGRDSAIDIADNLGDGAAHENDEEEMVGSESDDDDAPGSRGLNSEVPQPVSTQIVRIFETDQISSSSVLPTQPRLQSALRRSSQVVSMPDAIPDTSLSQSAQGTTTSVPEMPRSSLLVRASPELSSRS